MTKTTINSGAASRSRKATNKAKTITLADLCEQMKMKPREARMLLRLAVSKKDEFPALAEAHVPRQPWQWTVGSNALEEARKALTTLAE
ncbi:hypothetical protein [uncultured Erythrobacter sp.]|uniref:hypothetical protein n=1 Tax=uncultured Erythrobacter sp. TaxID=263913 RepID=UPI00262F1F14|nr:hypothetical protein [uncultured Erythrobacter sp.]